MSAEALSPAAGRVYRTVAMVLGVDQTAISDELSPDTAASWDSLNHLNLVMALESEFGVALSAEDALDMRTVGLIRTILRERGVDA